jgi:hypothetical protein
MAVQTHDVSLVDAEFVRSARPGAVRTYFAQARAMPAIIALALAGVFLPVVIVPYAFSDDYSILWMAVSREASPQFGKSILAANAIGGRPLAGLLVDGFFSAAGAIDNLRLVRLVALIGLVGLALLLHLALMRSGVKSTVAALIALLVCTLPAFQVYTAWAVLFFAPFAALLAGLASMLVVAAVDGQREFLVDRLVGAITLLFVALLIYQPPAMFFWVFFAIALIGAAADSRRAWRLVKLHFGVGAVGLALAYVELKLTIHFMGASTIGAARSHLNTHVIARARWFVKEPLYQSLNLFNITPAHWFAFSVAIVAAVGILLWLVLHATRPLLFVVVGLVLIPLAYLPNLVVTDTWPPFRTQDALSGLLALYLCLGAVGIWLALRDLLRAHAGARAQMVARNVALGGLVAFVAAGVFLAAKNTTTLIVEPQMTELRMLRSQVAALPDNPPRVAFVETNWFGGMTKVVGYDEFGLPSSARPWVLEPSLDLILREEGRLGPPDLRPVVDGFAPDTTTFPANEPVLDLRGLARLR